MSSAQCSFPPSPVSQKKPGRPQRSLCPGWPLPLYPGPPLLLCWTKSRLFSPGTTGFPVVSEPSSHFPTRLWGLQIQCRLGSGAVPVTKTQKVTEVLLSLRNRDLRNPGPHAHWDQLQGIIRATHPHPTQLSPHSPALCSPAALSPLPSHQHGGLHWVRVHALSHPHSNPVSWGNCEVQGSSASPGHSRH